MAQWLATYCLCGDLRREWASHPIAQDSKNCAAAEAAGWASALAVTETGSELLSCLNGMRHSVSAPSAVLIRNAPVDQVLPPTPTAEEDALTRCLASEMVLWGVSSILGGQVGYAQERNGRFVHNILPLAQHKTEATSLGSAVALGLHSECAFHEQRPDFVCLLCLRGGDAETIIVPVDDVVPLLSQGDLRTLEARKFEIDPPLSFRQSAEVAPTRNVAVLGHRFCRPSVRYHATNTKGMDRAAAMALEALHAAFQQKALRAEYRIRLMAGDLLIIDNRHAVHGRGAYSARFNGGDRWLLRVYVRTELQRPTIIES